MTTKLDNAFKRFMPAVTSPEVTASVSQTKVTSRLEFDDPTKCHYCGGALDKTVVDGETVLVCWKDRNVIPVYTPKDGSVIPVTDEPVFTAGQ